jgi:hypothetical protein
MNDAKALEKRYGIPEEYAHQQENTGKEVAIGS